MAMLSIQPMLEYLLLGIKLIKDSISIGLMASCKDDNLKLLCHFSQKSQSIRSDVNADFYRNILHFKLDL